jgi:hypothetical protein
MFELGYDFDDSMFENPFFEDGIRAFMALGIDEFNQTQKDILEMISKNVHFQVSGNGHCGCGKTTGTIFGILSHMKKDDKLICIKKFLKGGKGLSNEMIQHVKKFTNNKADIVDADDMKVVKDDLINADIIFTSCLNIKSLVKVMIENSLKIKNKIYILFDEAADIFNELEEKKLEEYENTDKNMLEPFIRSCLYSLYQLNQEKINFQIIFLSAVSDIPSNQIKAPFKVIEDSCHKWTKLKIHKVESTGVNSIRYTRVFKITRDGAFNIGGSTMVRDREVPLIYETMITIALNWLIDGRLLFILRRSQVSEFTLLLDKYIIEYGSYFTYTSDSKYWNDIRYNIIIVREDELKELQGRNIVNIKSVYLFTIGSERNIADKLQAMGRTGRLGQGVSWLFLFLDCCGTRNQTKELESQDIVIDSLRKNNSVQVITVKDESILNTSYNDIPKFQYKKVNLTSKELDEIQIKINEGNKKQICKFLSDKYECMYGGRNCSWYHPRKEDFVEKNILKSDFNISYCRKGLFRITK